MHFYQFHIGDYKSHTHHLSPMEDLAYRRLLDHYYLHEAPIKQRDIARQIGMREFEQDVLTVLDEFFVSTDVGFINPRADAEIAKFKEFSEAGKRGAAKRWAKATPEATLELPQKGSNGEANSPPNPTPIATNNHKPITNNQEEAAKRPAPVNKKITLATYLSNCKTAGKKPIPDDHYVREYAKDAGIADEMLQINWEVFKDRYLREAKLYSDWPKVFATSVKARWYGLWFIGDDGMAAWTSTGMQEKKVIETRMRGGK
jgi:uncharacterized protein YdaU (DUF1376 family)